MIKWTTELETMEVEAKIAKRATEFAKKFKVVYTQMDAIMDIDACHNNGNPLQLADLLKADDTDFIHDVFGIRSHIDRKTGKLQDCFVPRYSQPES